MRVEFGKNENEVIIDDEIRVALEDGVYTISQRAITVPATRPTPPKPLLDPKYYMGGENGLSILSSTSKALDTIVDMWGLSVTELDESDDYDTLWDAIERVIEAGLGRDTTYRLAGRVKNVSDPAYYAEVFDLYSRKAVDAQDD